MENTYSLEINAPRQHVFDYLADDDNLKDMVPNLVEHELLEETEEKVGTTFLHVYEENGRKMKMTGVVTEHQPPASMAVALDGPMFSMTVRYILEETGPNSTMLRQDSTAKMKHVFKIFGLLFGKKMKCEGERQLRESFARMKELMEASAPQA